MAYAMGRRKPFFPADVPYVSMKPLSAPTSRFFTAAEHQKWGEEGEGSQKAAHTLKMLIFCLFLV